MQDGDGVTAVDLIAAGKISFVVNTPAWPDRPQRRRADPQGGQPAPGELRHDGRRGARRGRGDGRTRGRGRDGPVAAGVSRGDAGRSDMGWRTRSTSGDDPSTQVDTPRHGRLGRAALAGDDRLGHGRLRHRAGRRRSTWRRSARSSPSRSPPSRGTATRRPASIRPRRGCSTRSGCRAPASSTGSSTSCPTSSRRARPSSPASGVARSTTTAGPPTCSPRRPPASSPSRSTCRAPTSEGRRSIFAHDPDLSAEVVAATAGCGRPRWAKLSANTDRIVDVAAAVAEAGAEAVTCINTMLGFAYDPEHAAARRSPPAAAGCRAGRSIRSRCAPSTTSTPRLPDLPIVGVGGVASGWDAAEMLLAGASAVQVGTALFADPAAPVKIQAELFSWAHAQWHSRHRSGRRASVTAWRHPHR